MLSTLVFYLAAMIALCLPEGKIRSFMAQGLATVGLIFHLSLLHTLIDTPQGQNLSLANLFSFITCLWVLMVLLASLHARLLRLLWVVLPVAMISLVLESMSQQQLLIPLGSQPLELWHVLASLGAYAFLGVAAMQAFVLLAQIQCLKRAPDAPWLDKLPPIEEVQQLMMISLTLGFGLLTLGMIGGFVKLNTLALLISKSSLTLIAWLIYAVLLVVRCTKGLIARWAALWVILGWLFLTFAYFGTKLISG